jgi:hypothetical protein
MFCSHKLKIASTSNILLPSSLIFKMSQIQASSSDDSFPDALSSTYTSTTDEIGVGRQQTSRWYEDGAPGTSTHVLRVPSTRNCNWYWYSTWHKYCCNEPGTSVKILAFCMMAVLVRVLVPNLLSTVPVVDLDTVRASPRNARHDDMTHDT